MKIFFELGTTVRIVFFSLLAGMALGFYLGTSATDHAPANDRAAVTDSRPAPGSHCQEKEVISWSRTSGSSCSAGS